MKYGKSLHLVLTVITALVWLINGLFCKVLHMAPRHEHIVSNILGTQHADLFTKAIGIAELCVVVWILAGIKPRHCAILQITAVAIMNTIEIIIVPDILMFGRWNALFALAFITLIFFTEFVLPKRLSRHSYTWAHS